jgi:hypothetical protein
MSAKGRGQRRDISIDSDWDATAQRCGSNSIRSVTVVLLLSEAYFHCVIGAIANCRNVRCDMSCLRNGADEGLELLTCRL